MVKIVIKVYFIHKTIDHKYEITPLSFQVTNLIYGEYQEILVSFSEMLNFKVHQFRRFDNSWGSFDKDTGQWNGMISNLINGEADFLPASLAICCKRTEVVEYMWILSQVSRGFAIKSMYIKIKI